MDSILQTGIQTYKELKTAYNKALLHTHINIDKMGNKYISIHNSNKENKTNDKLHFIKSSCL